MARYTLTTLIALTLAGSASAQQLLWSDEFNDGSVPDPTTWSYDTGTGANGWGNQELQVYTDDPANVAIADGNLRITALGNPGTGFTSGRIKTESKVTVKYGTIEARIKVPDLADGLWPAFWTLGQSFSQVGWPNCGELDVMEMGNASAINDRVINRRVGSTAHWESGGNYAGYGLSLDAPVDLNDDFHIFRMEWTPTLITTYLDGQQVWAIDISPSSCSDCEEFHQPHFMILNMAVGGTYTGRLVAPAVTATMPAEMLIDYVRVYDNGFTELGGTGVVVDSGPEDIGAAHSGSWYNASQSGHGFSMEFGVLEDGSPLALIYWYNYDSEGNPVFFVGTGVPDANGVDIEFLSPVGMRFGEFDPDTVVRQEAGTARFDFSDRDNGTFSYSPSEFSMTTWGHSEIVELPLEKLFSIPVSAKSEQ